MRRVQQGTPITDFGGRKQISFDALFSSDSEEEITPKLTEVLPIPVEVQASQTKAPPSPDFPYRREDDPISVWTQKVTESFEKASKKQLPPDFKESLGRLSFFRKAPLQQSVSKEQSSTTTVNTK
jgi:hypothetical protein